MIFFKKEFEDRINFAVFPSIQGGPHNNAIAVIAVQLKEVNTPAFVSHAKQIVANAQALLTKREKRGASLSESKCRLGRGYRSRKLPSPAENPLSSWRMVGKKPEL